MTLSPITGLQRLRRARGITQEELSRRTGISRATLSKVETGKRKVDRYVEALARELEVSERVVREAAGGRA